MRYLVHNQEVHVSESLSNVIAKKVEKIETRLKRYHPEVADLEIRLEHIQKDNVFGCNLLLKAFKDTLQAKKTAPELRVAVDRSFEAMLRELGHYRTKVNKSLHAGS